MRRVAGNLLIAPSKLVHLLRGATTGRRTLPVLTLPVLPEAPYAHAPREPYEESLETREGFQDE